MAIVRKGSHQIMVDGIQYRWRIRQKPARSREEAFYDGREEIVVSVEQAVENPGTALIISWLQTRTKDVDLIVVTPSMVADAIRRARQDGQNPLKRGAPFDQWNQYSASV